MTGAATKKLRQMNPQTWWLLVAVLIVGAVLVRMDPAAVLVDGEVHIRDTDTLRRLVRLEAIDAAGTYPVVETMDGYPSGTVIHFTLPWDWCLRSIQPIASWFVPGAKSYEAAAVVSGLLFSVMSLVVLLLGCRALLGPGPSLLAGVYYAFSSHIIYPGKFGVGDHQSLQQLLILGALLAWLSVSSGRRARWLPQAAGAALGLAVWVSTESMLFFYIWALAAVVQLALTPQSERATLARALHAFTLAMLAALFLGHFAEHRSDFFTAELDKVSWMQIWQCGTFALFTQLLRLPRFHSLAGVGLAALSALAIGVAPVLALSPLRTGLFAKLDTFASINVWLQNEIAEYTGIRTIAGWVRSESWLVLGLPIFLFGTLRLSDLPRPTRAALVAVALATFGLGVWEAKLAHLFCLTFAIVIGAGASGVVRARPTWLVAGAFAIVAAGGLTALPAPRSASKLGQNDRAWQPLYGQLRDKSQGKLKGAVLASWDLGAHFMYFAKLPVVASGYHRNIAGIRDSYRILLSQSSERASALALLEARGVRWVVIDCYDYRVFTVAPPTIGRLPMTQQQAKDSLLTRLRDTQPVPGFQLVATGPVADIHGQEQFLYKVFEFTGP